MRFVGVFVFLVSFNSAQAQFVDLAESAQKAADIAAIVSASNDLIKEVDEESKEISEMEQDIRDIRGKMNETETFGRKTEGIISGPNTNIEDSSSKIKGVTSYIRDLKAYYSKYIGGVLSPEAVTAIDNMRKNGEEIKTRKREAKSSLLHAKKEADKEKRRKQQREEDLKFRKAQNDEIKRLLGVGDVSNR